MEWLWEARVTHFQRSSFYQTYRLKVVPIKISFKKSLPQVEGNTQRLTKASWQIFLPSIWRRWVRSRWPTKIAYKKERLGHFPLSLTLKWACLAIVAQKFSYPFDSFQDRHALSLQKRGYFLGIRRNARLLPTKFVPKITTLGWEVETTLSFVFSLVFYGEVFITLALAVNRWC